MNLPDSNKSYWLTLCFIFALAFTLRLGFWWATNWAIEDGMIIARMVKNLVDFGQFSFNVETRVSSSTSPLFGLMAAAIAATGVPPLASAKLLGAAASSLTAVLIFTILYRVSDYAPGITRIKPYRVLSSAAASLIYIFLPPVISYAVSGLETAVYALLCALTLEQLTRQSNPAAQKRAVWLGSITTLFRPDGAIILVVVVLVILWNGRKALLKTLPVFWPILVVIPIGILLHQLYFGVPVPQSLIAKSSGYHINILRNARRYLNQMLFAQPGSILFYILGLFGVARAAIKAPRLLYFIFWYLVYHALFILRAPLFDWYLQAPLFVLCLFAGLGIFAVSEFFVQKIFRVSWMGLLRPAMGLGLGLALAAALVIYAGGRRESQAYSMTVQAAAGTWLTQNTPADALVFTESLGFIGYHAHNPFVDWPGLASPGVPALLAEKNVETDRIRAFDVIIAHYQPQYLVLRAHEWNDLDPVIRGKYQICADFKTPTTDGNTSYRVAGVTCN